MPSQWSSNTARRWESSAPIECPNQRMIRQRSRLCSNETKNPWMFTSKTFKRPIFRSTLSYQRAWSAITRGKSSTLSLSRCSALQVAAHLGAAKRQSIQRIETRNCTRQRSVMAKRWQNSRSASRRFALKRSLLQVSWMCYHSQLVTLSNSLRSSLESTFTLRILTIWL